MTKPQIYTKSKTFKFSEQQIQAFETLKKYDVNISKFVRLAISEKIKRDYKKIKEKANKDYCPF